MAHPRAKLTPLGRGLLVERVTRLRWPVAVAADSEPPGALICPGERTRGSALENVGRRRRRPRASTWLAPHAR